METIRTALFCGCCAALALTVAGELLPAERFCKQIRLLFTLIMAAAVLRSMTALDLRFDLPDPAAAQADAAAQYETAQALLRYAAAVRICNALNLAFAQKNIPCEVISVDVHIAADGSIGINEAVIRGNLLTGTVYLREWLGDGITVREEVTADERSD